ncbi:unnamed protein product [Penicillium olsonii]|nr:unnamed protein product [Penicillium olsonii]
MANSKPKTVLIDIGAVIKHPSTEQTLGAGKSAITLRRLMLTSVWMDYECGKLSEQDCFTRLASEYHLEESEIRTMAGTIRESTTYNADVVAILDTVRTSGTRVFLVANISHEDHAALRSRWGNGFWPIFDGVFTSSDLAARKPNLRFYRQVLQATRAVPHETFFIDERPENVLAALGLGMKGTFDTSDISRSLANFIGDPVERGLAFLRGQNGNFPTTTQYGETIDENYAPLLMREVLDDKKQPTQSWTACWITSMKMATFKQAYYDKSRPRADIVITLNILIIFHKYGRSYQLPTTMEWMFNVLLNRAYINGTRYYASAEWFLYYMVRLLRESTDPTLEGRIKDLLRKRVTERIGAPGDAFPLGMRLLACKYLGIENYPDSQKLADMQQEDGGWEASCLYYFPGKKREVGNRGASTAFALKALEGWF